MDLLHSGIARGFCIASGDSDFTPLVRRLRAQSLPVYGFGAANASAGLRAACNEFFLLTEPVALAHGGGEAKADQADLARLRDLLHSACREKGTDGKVSAAAAGLYLRQHARELVERRFGKADLVKKLVKQGLAETHEVDGKTLISVRFPKLKMVQR